MYKRGTFRSIKDSALRGTASKNENVFSEDGFSPKVHDFSGNWNKMTLF